MIRDRLNDLEQSHLCLRRRVLTPFLLPARGGTKAAAAIALGLCVVAVIFAFQPQSISIGGWRYESSGVSMEAIAAVGAAVGVFITLREHLKDKDEYAQGDRGGSGGGDGFDV